MTKVTIEDISRHTGLSRGTVSRALNDRPDISQQTKQRVLEACKTLNYVPSYAARSLATGRTFAVTVLIPDLNSSFTRDLLHGVLSRAGQDQYLVSVIELGSDPNEARDRLRMLSGERIDGLVVASELDPETAARVAETLGSRPIASTHRLPNVPADVLAPDYREAGRLLARELSGCGGPTALVVCANCASRRALSDGFRDILPTAEIIEVQCSEDLGALLSSKLAAARGIAAGGEKVAAGLYCALLTSGRIPGRDVAVTSFGNGAVLERISPKVTVVDPVGAEIGRRAMEIILQRLGKTRHDAPEFTEVAPVVRSHASSRLS
ncbi:MAG: LacI family DNA-binding transcriptional regulator [Phycisphaerales bacterium]|nr:LacI family DNA-binding transcriptional regulator [Phycisphaerales bacterium]